MKLKKIKGFKAFSKAGSEFMKREKIKAAGAIKLAEKMGGKKILHNTVYKKWYKAIDRAVAGKPASRDWNFWRATVLKKFEKSVVGVPNEETIILQRWLREFWKRVRRNEITEKDEEILVKRFRPYVESCEEQQFDISAAELLS